MIFLGNDNAIILKNIKWNFAFCCCFFSIQICSLVEVSIPLLCRNLVSVLLFLISFKIIQDSKFMLLLFMSPSDFVLHSILVMFT